MLVIQKLQKDLRTFIKENYSSLIWKNVYNLFWDITSCLRVLHNDNLVHRDLHPGNILQGPAGKWYTADFGLCGPANESSSSVYGNLAYMAPEVIRGAQYTPAADVYSIGMLMYHVVTGRPPFETRNRDYSLAFDICDGIRPQIVENIPDKYQELMKRCWDADTANRPNALQLRDYFLSECRKSAQSSDYGTKLVNQSSIFPSYETEHIEQSKVYEFNNLPIPRNATLGKNIV